MRTVKLDTQVRQDQITQAALGLLADRGMHAVSVSGVARRVGLVPSAVYRHFRNRDEMIKATIDRVRGRLLKNVDLVCAETPDAMRRLHNLLMRHMVLIRENPGIPRIIFGEAVFGSRADRRARVYDVVRTYLQKVTDIVREGQECGQIRPDANPRTVSVVFLGLIQPAALLWTMSEGDFDVTQHAERAWEMFERAIRTGTNEQTCGPTEAGKRRKKS